MNKITSTLILFLLLSSCSTAVKTIYGIKQPQVESKQSLLNYLLKKDLDTSWVVTVDTTAYTETLKRLKRFPEAEVFDNKGVHLRYKSDSLDCNAGLFKFIPNLKKASSYPLISSYNLSEHWKSLSDLNGNKLNGGQLGTADYYLFIYWSKWTGRLNKDHVKVWENLAKSNKEVNIKVIIVNLDLQSWWTEAFRKDITFKTK